MTASPPTSTATTTTTDDVVSFDCKDMSWSDQYKLMSSTVIPRPIALVSTEGPAGLNAAPFSFFNAIALGPPMLMFSIGPTQVEKRGKPKDTLVNIEATREFVIQLVDDRSLEKMNLCAPEYASDVNEMELAGFNMAPSIKVKPPRILDCPVQFECVLTEILVLGRTPYHVVIGEVVQAHYRSDIVDENLHIDMQALNPVGRLANPGMYARITDRFQLLPPQVGSNVLPSRTTPKQR